MIGLIPLLVAALIPHTDAFSAPKPSFRFPQLRNPFAVQETTQEDVKEDEGAQLLKELNLRSSTEPKVFSAADGALLDVLVAALPGIVRLGCGSLAQGFKMEFIDPDGSKYSIAKAWNGKQLFGTGTVDDIPQSEPIIIYDRFNSASCKLVREACSILALDVLVRPCPKNGKVYAPNIAVPVLEDPNTTVRIKNGDTKAILEYLFRVYGGPDGRTPPWALDLDSLSSRITWASFGLLLRSIFDTLNFASTAKAENKLYKIADSPKLPLQLYSYETSPYGALVQERLDALELEYVITYTPSGSVNRQRVYDMLSDLREYNEDKSKTGYFQVPLLVDLNTGVRLLESSAICEYLNKQYGVRTPVNYI